MVCAPVAEECGQGPGGASGGGKETPSFLTRADSKGQLTAVMVGGSFRSGGGHPGEQQGQGGTFLSGVSVQV